MAAGKQGDLLDKIYSSYASYKDAKDFVLVQVRTVRVRRP